MDKNTQCPLISVVIAAYNVQKYLADCLDSVLEQSYARLEIIVVNDASTDGTLALIERYCDMDTRVSLCDKPVNEGLPLARKSGMERASGMYIQYLDGDDTLLPGAIERLVSRAVQTEADMVMAPFLFVYEDGRKKLSKHVVADEMPPTSYYRELLQAHYPWGVWANLHKRVLYKTGSVEFVQGLSMGEDVILMMQLLLSMKKLVFVQEPSLAYRQHAVSVTATLDVGKNQEYRRCWSWVKAYLQSKSLEDEYHLDLVGRQILFVIRSIWMEEFSQIKTDAARACQNLSTYPELRKRFSMTNRILLRCGKYSPALLKLLVKMFKKLLKMRCLQNRYNI
ncbi:MAG: glycosyltransferase [Mediterranea sp.]|jgi:glycosyltransferase involved in cell wall biosynthesis|nr:glycosyltransferase [Mediterranea sp.]